jgi:hypothetical protein
MRNGTEITWILDGIAPERISMARLAEYLAELAALFGEADSVHFDRVERGSTKVVARLDGGASRHRVNSRISQINTRKAPADAQRAYDKINAMLSADKTRARIVAGGAVVLRFPGSNLFLDRPVSIIDTAQITGRIYALFEDNHGAVIGRLRPRSESKYVNCIAEGSIVTNFVNYFQRLVRVSGRGAWSRAPSGVWSCEYIKVQEVFPVSDSSLRDAVNSVRAIEADWPENPLADWAALDERDGAA